ncbi:MAG: Calx-beta domain-containing protein [Microcystis sp.]|uniref:beta strand repeat-containing protein n=1 Tax=Microcystis sp. TaxID=1127 RepID=UPI00391C6A51
MTSTLLPSLPAVYDILFDFAQSDGFWANLETAFGTGYDVVKATQLRQQWQSRDFSQLPPITVKNLGNSGIFGAYSSSINKIYISQALIDSGDATTLKAVLLEEIGHFIDAQINSSDTPGDEGQLFSALVRGEVLTEEQIAAIREENDAATITVDGQAISVEMAFGTPTNFSVGTSPVSVTVGDFNGDGKSDLATANYNGGNVSVFLNADPTATVTITDVSQPPISLTINDVTVTEGNSGTTNAVFTVSLSSAASTVVSVNYATANGTATAGTDYTALPPTTLTFNPGETSKTITVPVNGDNQVELNETFFLNLSNLQANGSNVILADNQGQGTITNDDSASIAISDVTITEGNSGTTNAVFTVTLSNAVDTAVTVNYATANGTATTTDNDYTAIAATPLIFNAGETSKTITVAVNGDNQVESNETFFVNLSNLQTNGRNVTLADNQGQGTILNDDTSVTLAVSPSSVTEDGTSNLIYTFTRSGVTSNALTVNYSIGGTATNGTDYASIPTGVTFAANLATATVTINPTADTIVESNETVILTLASGTGYTIGTTTPVTGTINNDDSASISINDVTVSEGNSGTTNAVFTVTLFNPVDTSVTLNYATANGTATTADNDYTAIATTPLTFNVGETSKTITVAVNGDTKVENNETFFVNLSNLQANGRNVTITDNQGQGTINDDDSTVTSQLSINDITVVEGKDNNAILTVTVDNPNPQPITFNYTTAPINANADVD